MGGWIPFKNFPGGDEGDMFDFNLSRDDTSEESELEFTPFGLRDRTTHVADLLQYFPEHNLCEWDEFLTKDGFYMLEETRKKDMCDLMMRCIRTFGEPRNGN